MDFLVDHFLKVIPEEEFAAAKSLLELFPSSEYSYEMSCHGLYFYSRDGILIEIIKEDHYWKPYMFGIGLSNGGPMPEMKTWLESNASQFDWNFKPYVQEDGTLMCNLAEFPLANDGLKVWTMDLEENTAREKQKMGKSPDNVLERVTTVRCPVSDEVFAKVPFMLEWIPRVKIIEADLQYSCLLPALNGKMMEFVFSKENPGFHIEFESGEKFDESRFISSVEKNISKISFGID